MEGACDSVGSCDLDGTELGTDDGVNVGAMEFVGDALGFLEGLADGKELGDEDGLVVGELVSSFFLFSFRSLSSWSTDPV